MAQQVKNLALSLQWLWLLLWHRFNPWPRNFLLLQMWPKKNKKQNHRDTRSNSLIHSPTTVLNFYACIRNMLGRGFFKVPRAYASSPITLKKKILLVFILRHVALC